jgi:hypothetical protein
LPTNREWLETLSEQLDARWAKIKVFDAYYEGDHDLAFATAKWREAFGSRFAQMTDNWMKIVVDSSVERLRVQGFLTGDSPQADTDAWDIWQANNLDGESRLLHTEAVKLGEGYWMVAPGKGSDPPRITAEHPSQVIVAHEPGDRRKRAAALKRWDGGDGYIYANVYDPEWVTKYRAEASSPRWAKGLSWEQTGSTRHRIGVVPIVPIRNCPTMLGGGVSDLAGGPIAIQNAINKTLSDMLIGSEFLAYPQRVLLGVEPPTDENGRPVQTLKASQSRLWYFNAPDAKVQEFSASDLANFPRSADFLVRHLAAQTKTPPHYILGEIVNASGDALKAAETGLVSKVKAKQDPFGEGHEETIRIALRLDGREEITAERAETIWADPETRSRAEATDSAVKLASIGVPEEVLWAKVGFSPTEIDRMLAMKETEDLLAPPPPPPPDPNQIPPEEQDQADASQPPIPPNN